MFAAPPNTPNKIIAILEKAVRSATADPEFKKLSENIGTTVDFKLSSELKK
jgi:tripartite-type tricarboxylate transporter receptor subunit TctC